VFTKAELVAKAKHLGLSRRLSQNFLINPAVIVAIATQASQTGLPIIEIASGAGFLTQGLYETKRLSCAIEIDPKMVAILKHDFPTLHVIHQDVRRVDLASLIPEQAVLVGNLPYHLTGPLLFQLIGEMSDTLYPLREKFGQLILMVQKEVGERLIALPGDAAYSQLTLQAQYWFDVVRVCDVGAQDFYPAPKVDSMVVSLTPLGHPREASHEVMHLSKLIKASFKHRRKTLLNSLKASGYEDVASISEQIGLSPLVRPQNVSLKEYVQLSNILCEKSRQN
jgi:16S rRNA (adenine1518-N6/adenine1519-N6)-dimethyltransferase